MSKVLVVGGGGREHSLVWKLHQSRDVEKIYAVPGNGGICESAECLDIDPMDFEGLASLVQEQGMHNWKCSSPF